jgi:alcohol dehydrogenase YqhD (iron-dependent ADH family)
MDNFTYQNGTKILFGRGTETEVGVETKKHSSKVLLHTGMGSIKRTGLFDAVVSSLEKAGVAWVELAGAQPNPRLSLVHKGIQMCREQKLDFILAVGGGSVIDSAKAIAAGVPYQGDVWDFFVGKAKVTSALPVGTVLTIPAAGSETSGSTVVTNEDGNYKKGLTSEEFLRPVFSILNPELTKTLPVYETAVGAADIMSHVFERYFTNSQNVDFSDRLCEAVLKGVIRNLPLVLAKPQDYDARAELMWLGTQAHSDLIGMGRVGDWATHDIEHELSGIYDVPHGAGLAVMFPAWMKFNLTHDLDRFCQVAVRVWNLEMDHKNPKKTALEGIAKLQGFWASCGLATSLEKLGIHDNRYAEMAEKATGKGKRKLGNFVKLEQKDVVSIYELASEKGASLGAAR